MGFWSGVSSFVSGVSSFVGSAMSTAAGWCGNALSKALDLGEIAIGKVGEVAGNLMHSFGIFKEDEKLEVMGDRAIQAEAQNIYPDQFDDFSQYIDKLRNFDLDPEKSKESTVDQKNFKGLEVAGRALEDKFNAPEGSMASAWLLAGTNPDYFTADRLKSLLDGGADISAVTAYFEGKMGGAESLEVEDALVNMEQAAQPDKDEQSIRNEIYAQAETCQNVLNRY